MKLYLDDQEWDFLPDDPTAFFLAAPLDSQRPPKPAAKPAILTEASQSALGAVLAVLLVSVGIVMGRYQLDDSLLSVAIALILAATLGGWWAATQGHKLRESLRTDQRAQTLRHERARTVLKVEDVLGESTLQTDDSRAPSASETAENQLTDSVSVEAAASAELDLVVEVGSPVPVDVDSRAPEDATAHGDPALPANDSPRPTEEFVELSDVHSNETLIEVEYSEERHFDEAILRKVAEVQNASIGHNDFQTGELVGPAIPPSLAIKKYLESAAAESGAALEPETMTVTEPPGDADGITSDQGIALTEIHGIGPALSEALMQLGVKDVSDLAELDDDDLDYLEQEMGHFGSRIRSQSWVEQARRLVGRA